jgi:hypothetical protein
LITARLYGNRKRNSAASCDLGDEWERNSEHDEHDDGAAGVEALVPQKDGEGADIKGKTADKNWIRGKSLGPIFRVWHSY